MTDPCYAHHVFNPWREKPNGTRVVAAEAQWRLPLKWNWEAAEFDRRCVQCGGRVRPDTGSSRTFACYGCQPGNLVPIERPRVFCASLSDVFEDWQGHMVNSKGDVLWHKNGRVVEAGETTPGNIFGERPAIMQDARNRLFDLIDATPNLDWLLLTKRPENVLRFTYDAWCPKVPGHVSQNEGDGHHWKWPSSVWLGTSVENRKALSRIDVLRKVPAAVRFLSVEPLLEDLGAIDLTGIDWVIVGGESGHGARPMLLEWARSIVGQCQAASVPVFVKQLGAHPRALTGCGVAEIITLNDRKGGDVDEWPPTCGCVNFPLLRGTSDAEV